MKRNDHVRRKREACWEKYAESVGIKHPHISVPQGDQAPLHLTDPGELGGPAPSHWAPCKETRGKQWGEHNGGRVTGNVPKVVNRSFQRYKNHRRAPHSINIKKSMHQSQTAHIKKNKS